MKNKGFFIKYAVKEIMIISCEVCKKKFEIESKLIPSEGRTLQCGSCNHKWHFKNKAKYEKKIILTKAKKNIENKVPEETEELINEAEIAITKKNNKFNKGKKINILSFLIVFIITITALIILADTFKNSIKIFIPNFESILYNLFETLKDVILFFIDLFR